MPKGGGATRIGGRWQIVQSVARPRLELGVRFCGQATLAAKVGFFLEQHQQSLSVPKDVLERLRKMRPKQPHYLDRRLGGKMAPGWNLLVPAAIFPLDGYSI